jgi:hypothetical protein
MIISIVEMVEPGKRREKAEIPKAENRNRKTN